MKTPRAPDNESYSDQEAEHRAREAIRRSFEMPYKPQKELVGKVGRSVTRKRSPSKATQKSE